jgi:ubiquinone biosynthesis protein
VTPTLAVSAGEIAVRTLLAVAIAVVTTSASLRLLGVRRGWGMALLAGLVGWGAGLSLALALGEWDWDAEPLFLRAVALAVPLTMVVAVGIDLLARPGSLAVGERAGLVVAPRPLRAVGTRLSVLRRYRELVRLARREGFGPFISPSHRASRSVDDVGVRMRRVLEQAGGVYIKMGQIAATRVDLLPREICDELSKLQNRAAPEPFDRITEVVRSEIGGDLELVFREFDRAPLASGSIGQTHLAVLRSGERVVVKVQRPGVEAAMERDLAALTLLARFAQRRTSLGVGVRPEEMLRQFAVGLRAELDFRKEAGAMEEMAVAVDASIRVPTVHTDLCTRRLLVQERFEGCTLADAGALDDPAIDRASLAEQLLRTTLVQVLRTGFFHADPHPGNVFVLSSGALGLIDFGAVGRLDPIQRAAITDILVGLSRTDPSQVREGIEKVADVAGTSTPDTVERALSRMIADHVRPGGHIDPTVLQDLVVTLGRHDIRLPTELVVLARALVTLDGTLQLLTPELSLVEAATKMVSSGNDPILDRSAMIESELLSVLPHLRRLPERVDRVLTLAGRGELRIRHVLDEDGRRILRTLVNRALLTAVGTAFLAVSGVLLVAADDGPAVSGGRGLYEILGFGGLLAGTVLLLRVVAAVARDGTT